MRIFAAGIATETNTFVPRAQRRVVTDNDLAKAKRVAREFGQRVFALRREIGFESIALSLEQALGRALVSQRRNTARLYPYVQDPLAI